MLHQYRCCLNFRSDNTGLPQELGASLNGFLGVDVSWWLR